MAQQVDPAWEDYTYDSVGELFKQFQERQKKLPNILISIKGGENRMPAKTLLRYYQAARDVDMSTSLCQDLFLNKEISFYLVDPVSRVKVREVKHIMYGGGDLPSKFDSDPWLLDILFDFAQGLLVKKLMPPSLDFGIPESGSEDSESPQTQIQ